MFAEKEGLSHCRPARTRTIRPATPASSANNTRRTLCCERALQVHPREQGPAVLPLLSDDRAASGAASAGRFAGRIQGQARRQALQRRQRLSAAPISARRLRRDDHAHGPRHRPNDELVKELGLDDNTIFIFTSDNGAVYPLAGYDPMYFKSNDELHGYKGDIYEGGIREPLIVRWKGHVPRNTTSNFVSGHEDWMPTLLELAGATNSLPKNCRWHQHCADAARQAQEAAAVSLPRISRLRRPAGRPRRRLETDPAASACQSKETRRTDHRTLRPRHRPVGKRNVAAANPDLVAKLGKLLGEQHTPSKEFPIPIARQTRG